MDLALADAARGGPRPRGAVGLGVRDLRPVRLRAGRSLLLNRIEVDAVHGAFVEAPPDGGRVRLLARPRR